MAEEKKEGGWLSKVFWGAAKLVTVGVAAAVGWQLFLDPIFFPIFHDPTNVTAQAFVQMINSTFSFIPDLLGLTGDGGLLQTEWAQNMLEPYKGAASMATPETVTKSADLMSLDALTQ